jgi:hypothetical protein
VTPTKPALLPKGRLFTSTVRYYSLTVSHPKLYSFVRQLNKCGDRMGYGKANRTDQHIKDLLKDVILTSFTVTFRLGSDDIPTKYETVLKTERGRRKIPPLHHLPSINLSELPKLLHGRGFALSGVRMSVQRCPPEGERIHRITFVWQRLKRNTEELHDVAYFYKLCCQQLYSVEVYRENGFFASIYCKDPKLP